MIKIRDIIENLGGLKKAADFFGVPVSTIQHWKETNSVPHWRVDFILNKLKQEEGNNEILKTYFQISD